MEISPPSTLARLPHPADQSGRTLYSQVYGLRSGVKRKRQEICAAIDGDSINIYEVHGGRNLFSHPVAPDASFVCAPTCIRSKTETGVATRRLYCVTRRRKNTQLQLITERAESSSSSKVTTSVSLEDGESAIIGIEAVNFEESEYVFIIRKDGSFSRFTADLIGQPQDGTLGLSNRRLQLVIVRCLSSTEASKSILKSRPDIVAATHPKDTLVAAVFTGKPDGGSTTGLLSYGVWTLPVAPLASPDIKFIEPTIWHCLQLQCSNQSQDRDTANLNAQTTRLTIHRQTTLTVFDLTGVVPRKTTEYKPLFPDQSSCIMVSDAMLLSSNSNGLQLQNTQFRSLQASLGLDNNALKRRRGADSTGPVVFVAYLPQMKRAIATRRNSLIAIDLKSSQDTVADIAFKETSALINNIGKGAPLKSNTRTSQQSVTAKAVKEGNGNIQSESWHSVQKSLENYISIGDLDRFEDAFMAFVTSVTTTSALRVSEATIDFAISTIFQRESNDKTNSESTSEDIKVVRSLQRVFRWLASQGYLSGSRVIRALSQRAPARPLQPTESDYIVSALSIADPSLSMLKSYLSNAPLIDLQALCAIVRLLIRRALLQSETLAVKNDQNADAISAPDVDATGNADSKGAETSVATIEVFTSSLRLALERLAASDPRQISKSLSVLLEQQDLIALIQYLRQQLFYSGYTKSVQSHIFAESLPSSSSLLGNQEFCDENSTRLSSDAIFTMLSACVDAIGPLGIIRLGEDVDFVETLIPELSSEVSRAMEALEDATYLQGILRETLRFSEATNGSQLGKSKREDASAARDLGAIITLYTEAANDEGASSGSAALPLSLQPDSKISPHKVRKGGGQVLRRSKREIGMLQDRLRGPYALERLVL